MRTIVTVRGHVTMRRHVTTNEHVRTRGSYHNMGTCHNTRTCHSRRTLYCIPLHSIASHPVPSHPSSSSRRPCSPLDALLALVFVAEVMIDDGGHSERSSVARQEGRLAFVKLRERLVEEADRLTQEAVVGTVVEPFEEQVVQQGEACTG